MKGEYLYIVTNVEHGWDCVCGLYVDSDAAYLRCAENGETLEEITQLVEDGDTAFVVHRKIVK